MSTTVEKVLQNVNLCNDKRYHEKIGIKFVHPMEELLSMYEKAYHELASTKQLKTNHVMLMLDPKKASFTEEQVNNAKATVLDYAKKLGLRDDSYILQEHLQEKRIRAYLAREQSLEENKQLMLNAMKYKYENLQDFLCDKDLPREFSEFKVHLTTGFDNTGSPVMYVFGKNMFVNRNNLPFIKKYLGYFVFRMEKLALRTSGYWSIMFDVTGAGFANFNLELASTLISLLKEMAPAALSRVILYNMHWLFKPLLKLCLKMVPKNVNKEIVVVSDHEELTQYIDKEQLPPIYGGSSEMQKLGEPHKDAPSVYSIAEKYHQMTIDQVTTLVEDYKKRLEN